MKRCSVRNGQTLLSVFAAGRNLQRFPLERALSSTTFRVLDWGGMFVKLNWLGFSDSVVHMPTSMASLEVGAIGFPNISSLFTVLYLR